MAANQEIIRKLRDIHLPEPASMFPLPPAWWAVIGLVALLLLGLGYYFYYHRKKQNRMALKALKQIETRYQQGESSGVCMMELGQLLKQYAMIQFPQTSLAHLWGEPWLAFLLSTSTAGQFEGDLGDAILQWPYQREPERHAIPALIESARAWLKENPHRSYRKVRLSGVEH